MKIAVDAMGGDYAPGVVIEGVLLALQEIPGLQLVLVGHQEKLSFYLEKAGLINHPQVELVHAEQVVEMSDHSTDSIRSKKHSSITVCADLVKAGRADAIVSAGHTGAAVAATKVRLRTLEGVDRPALATAMPAVGGKNILIDVGANTDCTPMNLAQFAVMGELYAQLTFGLESPRIGLLSVGGEDVKGNDLTKEVFKILSNMPINFVGNVEGHDIFHKSTCDVIVCDGFTGNSILKAERGIHPQPDPSDGSVPRKRGVPGSEKDLRLGGIRRSAPARHSRSLHHRTRRILTEGDQKRHPARGYLSETRTD